MYDFIGFYSSTSPLLNFHGDFLRLRLAMHKKNGVASQRTPRSRHRNALVHEGNAKPRPNRGLTMARVRSLDDDVIVFGASPQP